MRHFLSSLAIALMGWVPVASAQTSVVVVELYTSQGCSSCPAADVILSEIAPRDDVIALGLHVDYWDYLGWADSLARPEFTKRQEIYNTVLKSRYRLVTPQMIMQGRDYVAGAKRRKILDYIKMLRDMPEGAALQISRDGTLMKISLAPISGRDAGEAVLHIVRYTPVKKVTIKGGENRGKTVNYTNIVTRWDTVAKWDGSETMALSQDVSKDEHVVVILQTKDNGPILVARRLD